MDFDGLTWEDRGTVNTVLWESVWHRFPKFGGEWLTIYNFFIPHFYYKKTPQKHNNYLSWKQEYSVFLIFLLIRINIIKLRNISPILDKFITISRPLTQILHKMSN